MPAMSNAAAGSCSTGRTRFGSPFPPLSPPMNTKTASALLLCAVALCATALPSAHATQSGSPALSPGLRPTLIGTVTNQATGRTLEGARVVLQGTGRETLTDRKSVV